MGDEQTHIDIFMHKPACTRPVLITPPQYSFYSKSVHCEIVFLLFHHLCRPQSLCSRAARPGIPTSGHTPRGPLEDTSDRWWAAITRRHVLHSCRVTSLVFNSTCSDSTYAGHYLLRPLLTTVLVVKKQNIKPHNPFRYEMSG